MLYLTRYYMDINISIWIFLAFMGWFLPFKAASAYDLKNMYVFVPREGIVDASVPNAQADPKLREAAHRFFSQGVWVRNPPSYHPNMAWDFYGWLSHEPRYDDVALTVYPNRSEFTRRMNRLHNDDVTGILFQISSDDRSFPLPSTVQTLSAALPEGPNRIIHRFLSATNIGDQLRDLRVTGLPLPRDRGPVNPLIQGENIIRGYIVINGEINGQTEERNETDGPFSRPVRSPTGFGYPFNRPTGSIPDWVSSVTVNTGGTNVTFANECDASSFARATLLARLDRKAKEHGACERITLEEFIRRYASHHIVSTAVQFLLW